MIYQLRQTAAIVLRCNPEDVEVAKSRAFLTSNPDKFISIKEIAHGYKYTNGNAIGGPVIGKGSLDNQPMKFCLMLAIEATDKNTTTIEGLHDTPIQTAFLDKWAFHCGYCTSGFIMNCYALANNHPDANEYEVENWLQSNICRSTSYEEIKEAMMTVLKEKKADTSS